MQTLTAPIKQLEKSPTGIDGLDQITFGGLPKGRPTLICGNAGCGKTLIAMEFLVRGINRFDEPGVFMSFEERIPDLEKNFSSLGYNITDLVAKKRLALSYVHIERNEIEETGEYDLDGLFVRLEHAINSVNAKRVVLDTIESLFSGFTNTAILRGELRRLFQWLKDKGVTTIITGEKGEGRLTRQGLEEYVSDCVIFLDHRIVNQVSTRRLSVIKYRGSAHGTNEYPFLIDERGVSILPITSLDFAEHQLSRHHLATGIESLDQMLEGKGYPEGTTIMIAGGVGSGKTSFGAHFVDSVCSAGRRALVFSYEESIPQYVRNMRSIGIDLKRHMDDGHLKVHAARPTLQGLEAHLVRFHRMVEEFKPDVVVIDPITSFVALGAPMEIGLMFTRLIDYLKMKNITFLFSVLSTDGSAIETENIGVSSLVDTLITLSRTHQPSGLRREVCVFKSRGMNHDLEPRPYAFSSRGIVISSVPMREELCKA